MVIALLLLALHQDGGEVPTGRPASSLGVRIPTTQGTTGRVYHRVRLASLATTRYTHVEVCGPVVYVRKQQDGDLHITLSDGTVKVVVEIIPAIPLPRPVRGQIVRVRGISRIDKDHGAWAEVHPAEAIDRVAVCP
jgi:hypothetical protein